LSESGGRALLITRVATIAVALGAVFSPAFANYAAVFMIAAFFFVPDWRARMHAVAVSHLGKGMLVFSAALLVATLVAAFQPQGLAPAFLELRGWRTLLLTAIAFAVFDSAQWKLRMVVVFIVFATIGAILSLIAWKIGWGYKGFAPGIILRNSVTQAMAFAIGAFFAGVLLVVRPNAAPLERLALVAAMLLLLGQLLFLQLGRSGQLLFAILAVVAAALMLRGPRRVLAVASMPVLAAVAFVVSPVMHERFKTAWHELGNAANATEYTSMGIRVVMWQNTVELIRARPVLGYGLGGLEPAYAGYIKDRASGWKATVTDDPHNQFLAVWVEMGLPGLLAFLFLLACAARQPAPYPWRQIALAFLGAWCATSMVSSHFQTFNEGHLIAIFLGAFLARAGSEDPVVQAAANAAATAAATSS
jgi:O-antigen ligase